MRYQLRYIRMHCADHDYVVTPRCGARTNFSPNSANNTNPQLKPWFPHPSQGESKHHMNYTAVVSQGTDRKRAPDMVTDHLSPSYR